MQNDNLTNQFLIKFNKIKSFISQPSPDETNPAPRTSFNHPYIKLILFCFLISTIYLFLSRSVTLAPPTQTNTIQILKNFTERKLNRTKLNAFIITANCTSLRYNATKENIEGAFPNFFNYICFLTIPLTDPRIHTSDEPSLKKFSSNLLAFIEIWTYKIPEYSKHNPYEWSFIFEDDVNFMNATKVFLPDYIIPLQNLMKNPEIQMKDGFLYLGICGPEYLNDSQVLIAENTNNNLTTQKGCGFCLHATGITAKRSKLFWTEISSYRPNPSDSSLDLQIRQYSIRSKNYFYIFGTNFHFPPGTGHYGIAYQDRGRFSTTVA